MVVTPRHTAVRIDDLVLDGVAPDDPLVFDALRQTLAPTLREHADAAAEAVTARLPHEDGGR
jgi:hypothetical protein